MQYLKVILLALTHITLSSCASTGVAENALNGDVSREICGHTVVKHNDDTWSIFKNGNKIETLSAGFTLQDIKDAYCV